MLDSVIGLFEDRESARAALDQLEGDGWRVDRISMKRVRKMSYRGFADSEKAHSLMHAPEVPDSAPLAEDEGIPLVIVKVERDHVETARDDLGRAGAVETQVVEATPPIEL